MAKAPATKRPAVKRPVGPPRATGLARVEYLKIENYRALRSVELDDITPLTVLLGPNGSGKSTIFDVFNFLSECFAIGLRKAWDKRGRFRELRTRGSRAPILIELRYRETPDAEPSSYRIEIDEVDGNPVVVREYLKFRRVARGVPGAPYMILSFRNGRGWAIAGPSPGPTDKKLKERLDEPDMLAVSTLGRLAKHPRVAALRRFISDWYVSYLSVDDARGIPEAGAQDRLSKTGDNLANVVQHLQEQHPGQLLEIFKILARRVPQLEKVVAEQLPDGRLMLRMKDAPFDDPILAKFASDGTLKMLAYLVVLHDPMPPQFIGIEEPENFLHPRLLLDLAEECRAASERAQLLVTTHSPFFVDGLRAGELRILYRNSAGHTNIVRASDVPGVPNFIEAGAVLGQLWMEGHLDVRDTPIRGMRRTSRGRRGRGGKA
ncbi:MAG: AAA family ATPase [Deltaproteobacteria bacterium]|nr:AAA family ATPase [Deltaproteobacteria bacterium]